MENLQNIINSNIKWFWNNDSLVEYEIDTEKLWIGFKVWCIQNCKEIFEDLEVVFIEQEVNKNYSNWLNGKTF